MSLFERIKNIRYDLQEKRKFPGDESGAYKQAKDDLEARKGFSKNKPGGLKADEKNPFVKRSVRKSRVDKLGGDIYDAPKFSQKGFEKSLKKVEKLAKTPKYKRKSYYRYPLTDPFPASKGDTPGEIRVKGLDRKAFKKTKPSDIKLPKSFRDFQRNLQDYKDRNVPGGPKKYKQTELKFSSKKTTKPSGSRFDPDIGMAPPDTPKTKGVKQSEVSKKAKDFTKNINQKRNKNTFKSFKKQADAASNKLVAKREVVRSTTGTKDVKQLRDINKQIKSTERISKGYDLASKGKGNLKSPVVRASDLKQVTDNTPKVKTPTKVGQKGFVRKPSKFFQKNIDFSKVPDDPRLKGIEKSSELKRLNKQMGQDQLLKAISRTKIGKRIASTKAGKLAIKGTSAIAKSAVKNPYTAAATVVGAGLLTQPNVRKGIKAALTGGGIGALTGAFAKDNRKNKPAEYGKKTYLKKGSISLSPSAPKKETNYSKTMSSVKPYDFTKIDKTIKADQTAKKNALSASEKQKQRRGIG